MKGTFELAPVGENHHSETELGVDTEANDYREIDLEIENERNHTVEQAEVRPPYQTENSFYGWESANSMLNTCAENTLICAGVVALVIVAGIIFTTAFTTCSKTYINNKTSDLVIFDSVRPRFTDLHSPIMSPFGRNNVSYAFGKDYAKLGTLSHGTLHTKDNGECSLTGKSDRVLKPSYIFFFSCYCDYKKGDNSQPTNTTSTQRYLRGSEEYVVGEEAQGSMDSFLTNGEQSFSDAGIKEVKQYLAENHNADSADELAIVPYQSSLGV